MIYTTPTSYECMDTSLITVQQKRQHAKLQEEGNN